MINLECETHLWQTILESLKARTGLASEHLGELNIRRSIAHRMKITQIQNVPDYWKQLQKHLSEWQAFLDEVVIPETSFFRDRIPFEFLAQWSHDRITQAQAPLKILSLPCSTGEEAYSIALALLGSGLKLNQFFIQAIDLSDRALNIAKRGEYTAKPGDVLWKKSSHYWHYQNHQLSINPEVKQSIHFKLGNIIDFVTRQRAVGEAPYDVIFCRNLLIYFDLDSRQQVLSYFDRLLKPDGLLFVGHAETGSLNHEHWTVFPHSYAFAYQKNLSSPKPTIRYSSHPLIPTSLSSTESKTEAQSLLDRSRTLADRGELEEALNCCEAYLRNQSLCGEGHFLMGQICQAMGTLAEADRFLAKAIYLMPNHTEALMQLALLREGRGDRSGATILKERARRRMKN